MKHRRKRRGWRVTEEKLKRSSKQSRSAPPALAASASLQSLLSCALAQHPQQPQRMRQPAAARLHPQASENDAAAASGKRTGCSTAQPRMSSPTQQQLLSAPSAVSKAAVVSVRVMVMDRCCELCAAAAAVQRVEQRQRQKREMGRSTHAQQMEAEQWLYATGYEL